MSGVERQPWQTVAPGKLRHLVTIQVQSTSQDSVGQPFISWSNVRTCWASIESIALRELFGASQLTAEVSHSILIRWTSTDIQPGMRITYNSRIYHIQSVDDVLARKTYVELLCLELDAGTI